jgi:hypothetical protein
MLANIKRIANDNIDKYIKDNGKNSITNKSIIQFTVGDICSPTYNGSELKSNVNGIIITLVNKRAAEDPTFDELMTYFLSSRANKILDGCLYGWSYSIHNDIEAYGIRCGYVMIDKWRDSNFGQAHGIYSCLAFDTVDKGLIYIDCIYDEKNIFSFDWRLVACVNVRNGQAYKPVSLLAPHSFELTFVVDSFCIYW